MLKTLLNAVDVLSWFQGGDRIMELKNRSQYLDKLISVQDMEVIKVVTGIRRCGKSSLLKLMMAHLREQGVTEEQILSMNFESMQFVCICISR